MASPLFQVAVTDKPLDLKAAQDFVADPAFGAITSFSGVVRNNNEGRAAEAVTYDMHEPLAVKALQDLCVQALKMNDNRGRIYVAHAKGRLKVGEPSVIIAVATPHRKESFKICSFMIDCLKVQVPIWKNEHYLEGDSAWLPGTPLAAPGNESETRYARQEVLPEIGIEGQKKLASARVLVVGAGGLGCPVLQYLAGAGVGTIGIIDHDVVDVSNLQRQVLYAEEDRGREKAIAAQRCLSRLNSGIELKAYAEELTAENALGLFSGYDVIVDGTDNFNAKFLINDAAVKAGKPVVHGAIQGFEGQVSVFDPARGPCYRCIHPRPPQNVILNCAEAGAIGALAGIVGTMQAMEVIKLVVGHDSFRPLIGRLCRIDARTMETHILNIPKQAQCPVCSKPSGEVALQNYSPVCSAVVVEDVDCSDGEALSDAVLIDVRELPEWEAGHIKGARHLPLSVLQKNPEAFTPPANGQTCVVYCQKGVRGRKAVEMLLSAGFSDICNMKGGYEAWCAIQGSTTVFSQ